MAITNENAMKIVTSAVVHDDDASPVSKPILCKRHQYCQTQKDARNHRKQFISTHGLRRRSHARKRRPRCQPPCNPLMWAPAAVILPLLAFMPISHHSIGTALNVGLAMADEEVTTRTEEYTEQSETTQEEDAASMKSRHQNHRQNSSEKQPGLNVNGGASKDGDNVASRHSSDDEDRKEFLHPLPQSDGGPPNLSNARRSFDPTVPSPSATPDDDEQTYLDIFGERAKELFTQHIIPATDAECRWDWQAARCESHCDCALRFKWGDYHLGRSCRARPRSSDGRAASKRDGAGLWTIGEYAEEWTVDNDGDPDILESSDFAASCSLPPETPYAKTVRRVSRWVARGADAARMAEQAVSRIAADAHASARKRRDDAAEAVCRAVRARAAARVGHVVVTKRGAVLLRALCDNSTAALWTGEQNTYINE